MKVKYFFGCFGVILLIFVISLGSIDKNLNAIYDDIIKKIDKNNMPLEFTGGYSKYVGYQFYDRDLDGINELYIYRIHDFLNSNNGMTSKPFIYEAYKVEDYKPVLFLNGEPRGVATCDNCYFVLKDNKIAYLTSGHSEENIIIYDNQNNIISKSHCDYAFVAGNPDHDVYRINDTEVSKNQYRKSLEIINDNIGFFPIELKK